MSALTGEEHYRLSGICLQEQRTLDGIYHYLMALEQKYDCYRDMHLVYPTGAPGMEDLIFITTQVLIDQPEYSCFWEFLGHIYSTRRNIHSDDYLTETLQCYHNSMILGNTRCVWELWSVYVLTGLPFRQDVTRVAILFIDILQNLGSSENIEAWEALIMIFSRCYCGLPKDLERANKYRELLTK